MTSTSRWRPNYNYGSQNYQQSNRPAAVSHNQFVSRPSVPSKIVIPETSNFHSKERMHFQIPNGPQSLPKRNDVSSRLNTNCTTITVRNNDAVVKTNKEIQQSNKPDTALSNTKKRITKKMSEINLDRDSGNSSPTELSVNNDISFPVTGSEKVGGGIINCFSSIIIIFIC